MTRQNKLLVWVILLAGCVAVIWHTRFVADLSAFLPKLPTERQQMLADQLRDGVVARLIMLGIEGGTSVQRAKWSRELAEKLSADDAFLGVQNGDDASMSRDRAYFFDHRYLLSPAVNAERFTPSGLKSAIQDGLALLASDAGVIFKHIFTRDPTAETINLLEQMSGAEQPNRADGVWASKDGSRAVMLLQTRAAGSDLDAQSRAHDSIRQAFTQVTGADRGAKLLMSGTAVFAVSSRQTIEHEVKWLATVGFAFVSILLLLVLRSPAYLLIGALPIVSGALAGVAAVSLAFGQVHGLTLAFGTTLIGEAVDYSIYLFMQRAGGHAMDRFWRTIRLGVLTSVAGFVVLVFSSFPGLAQLGVYSTCGLLVAVGVTRHVVHELTPNSVKVSNMARLGRWIDNGTRWARRYVRHLPMVLLVACMGYVATRDAVWNDQLSGVNPTLREEQLIDAKLRSDLGAPDLRYVASFHAANEQAALEMAERIGEVFKRMVDEGALGGYNSPATVLPSLEAQKRRQTALPETVALADALNSALRGVALQPSKLAAFVADVAAAREHMPLTRQDLSGTSAAMLYDSLMIPRSDGVLVLMPLRPVDTSQQQGAIDTGAVTRALTQAGIPTVSAIDILEETRGIFVHYLKEALLMTGLGALAVVLLLLASLRSLSRTWRVCLPLASAVLVVTALLLMFGQRLTILHLVGLLLVVAVGSNYALFYESGVLTERPDARQQTYVSLLIANLTTVAGFGLLALSKVPVLVAVGLTVAPGAFLALVFSAMACGEESV